MEFIIFVEAFVLMGMGVWIGRGYQRRCEANRRMAFIDSPEYKALSIEKQMGACAMWGYLIGERP